ncbi:serine/threonine kinase [Rhizoctonia solani AG-1 IA]|uniref:non-specific serine/threonine protein kinase n=1 Tax=Thanatephorus cucumeris (strain AG1-IA) TaxID=983506 RepID=L8WIH6_THACA|nr:serine/threonine kinase [Rhizoctonia solani AG-1 IA]
MTPAVSRPPDDNEAHPYVITNEIGKGSFATVYRGYHGESRRAVAIKTISRSILTTKLLDNLESEINILKSLKNKHITELTDIVKAQRNIYLIMEFCSGGDLSSYIKHRGRIAALHTPTSPAPAFLPHPKVGGLSDSVVRSFIGQLSSAMKFLRARDLIHRDVKPQNLLLSPADSVDEYACVGKGGWIPGPVGTPILKVADFGFARILPNASMAETLCGSPLYMAPEILRYEKYDAKADLWSVGAVVYEAAVGRPPFRAQNHIELLKKIDHARSRVHFPDEDPKNADAIARGDLVPVSPAVKLLIRSLLKRKSVERKSFEDFFVMAEEVVKPVMEPERDVGSELADAMNDATIDGGMGAPGAGTGTGSTNGSLKIELRASRRAPQPPPKSAVEKPTEPVERPTSPTSDGGEKPKRRKPRGEIEAGPGGGPEIDVKAVMPQSTFKFRRAVRPEDAKVVERIDGPPIEFPGPRPKPLSAVNGKLKKTGSNQSLRSPVAAPVPEGEEEGDNDGDMRKEYVLVDETNAVEFNRVVDELDHARLARPTIRTTKSTPPTSATIAPIDVPASASPTRASGLHQPSPASTPASALARALNLASKKLFGTSASSHHSGSSAGPVEGSPAGQRRQILLPPTTEPDPEEEHLLGTLEDLAQKAETIAAWADSKYTLVDARPSKPIADPARFARAVGETAKGAETRRKHEVEVEMAAVTAIGLYMAVMSFATGAIVIARRFLDGREGAEVSAGFDEAQKWFRDAFHRSTERVSILKHWLPRDHVMPQMWIDRVIYDHALTLMRGAASRELLEDYSTCERDYEDALWLLYAIYDDIMQEGNPYKDQDRVTIGRFIKSTKDRLVRVQKRIERQKAQQQQVAAQS